MSRSSGVRFSSSASLRTNPGMFSRAKLRMSRPTIRMKFRPNAEWTSLPSESVTGSRETRAEW